MCDCRPDGKQIECMGAGEPVPRYLAMRLRFCAVAVRRNSSLAPTVAGLQNHRGLQAGPQRYACQHEAPYPSDGTIH